MGVFHIIKIVERLPNHTKRLNWSFSWVDLCETSFLLLWYRQVKIVFYIITKGKELVFYLICYTLQHKCHID